MTPFAGNFNGAVAAARDAAAETAQEKGREPAPQKNRGGKNRICVA